MGSLHVVEEKIEVASLFAATCFHDASVSKYNQNIRHERSQQRIVEEIVESLEQIFEVIKVVPKERLSDRIVVP